MGVDNLYLQNGRVKLCDPFLSRQNLLKELIKPKSLSGKSSNAISSLSRIISGITVG